MKQNAETLRLKQVKYHQQQLKNQGFSKDEIFKKISSMANMQTVSFDEKSAFKEIE